MIDIELLKKLCIANSASGDEKKVRDLIMEEIDAFADSVDVDMMGNLIVFKKGKRHTEKKLMICAHMDEIGFIITNITDDGFLKFSAIGGIDSKILPGKRVFIGDSMISGVIGVKPVHLLSKDEADSKVKIEDMYIDIGVDSSDDALKHIKLGDFAYFEGVFSAYDEVIRSKAIDDRVGCLILIEMIKSETLFDTYFVFTVQEEIGGRGAKVAAYSLNPDSCIVVESTTASDVLDVLNEEKVCCLGKGAVVSFMDKGTIYDREYVRFALDSSRETHVDVQIKRAVCGGNDASVIHVSNGGIRTVALSLACRYIHSPVGIVSVRDIEALRETVVYMALKIFEDFERDN